jgi:LSD1 subclass zinc finger protein
MQVICDGCKKALRIPDTAAGKKVRCPMCQTVFTALPLMEIGPTTTAITTPPLPRISEPASPLEQRPPEPDHDRDEDDDVRPRRRRDRYDDDDEDDDRSFRRYSRSRSGAVTVIGIIQIVLGSLGVLLSFCMMIGGVFLAGAPNPNPRGPGPGPGAGFMGLMGGAVILIGLVAMLFGGLYIFAGIGVLNRRSWSRILSLVLGGFTGLSALFSLLGALRLMANPGQMGSGLGNLVFAALQLAFVVFMYTILLNSRYASEFATSERERRRRRGDGSED